MIYRWIAKPILPLVYDDSLSYYEVLCKLTKYINDMAERTNAVDEEIERIDKVLAELTDMVEHYYDNPAITAAINDKLDEMYENGELATLIGSLSEFNYGCWGVSNAEYGQKHFLIYSPEPTKIFAVQQLDNAVFYEDAYSVFNTDDFAYAWAMNYVNWTRDFVTWYRQAIPIVNPYDENYKLWPAQVLFTPNGNYAIFTVQRSDATTDGDIGSEVRYWNLEYCEITFNQDGSIDFGDGTLTPLNLNGPSTSYIDASALWIDDKILLACKNELTAKMEVYTGTSLDNLVRTSWDNPLFGYEAMMLYRVGNTVECLCDGYCVCGYTNKSGLQNRLPQMLITTRLYDHNAVQTNAWKLVYRDYQYRHPGLNTCNKFIYYALAKLGLHEASMLRYTFNLVPSVAEGSPTDIYVPNLPGAVLSLIGGNTINKNIRLLNAFESPGVKLISRTASQPAYTVYNVTSGPVAVSNIHDGCDVGFIHTYSLQTASFSQAWYTDSMIVEDYTTELELTAAEGFYRLAYKAIPIQNPSTIAAVSLVLADNPQFRFTVTPLIYTSGIILLAHGVITEDTTVNVKFRVVKHS